MLLYSTSKDYATVQYEYEYLPFVMNLLLYELHFSMAVVAVPFILYLVRFCSSKSCKVVLVQYE